MHLFLKRILIFVLFCSFFSLISGFILIRLIIEKVYSTQAFTLSNNIETIFMGDSHAMCAFNDSIIPNSFNASRNSEIYFQTCAKLQFLLKANTQIKRVVLSYSPHNIAFPANNILYGDRYYPMLDTESRVLIKNAGEFTLLSEKSGLYGRIIKMKHDLIVTFLNFKWTWGIPVNLDSYWDYLIEPSSSEKKLYLHPVFTLPYTSTNSKLDNLNLEKAIIRHFGNSCHQAPIAKKHLCKIIQFCEKQNVELVLINTPLHPQYRKKIPVCYNRSYKQFTDSILSIYDKVHFLDLSYMFFPDYFYGDGDHLNNTGNKPFSEFLISQIDSVIKISGK